MVFLGWGERRVAKGSSEQAVRKVKGRGVYEISQRTRKTQNLVIQNVLEENLTLLALKMSELLFSLLHGSSTLLARIFS